MDQHIIKANGDYKELGSYLASLDLSKLLLVCDDSLQFLKVKDFFDSLENDYGIKVVKFSDFQPNPLYESVVKGVEVFHKEECDAIFAVGGGSAMDVAKCIKLYSNMDDSINYLEQEIIPNDVKLMAMPTTAGTGSEATKFAVIYYEGVKQSVADDSCIPSVVVFDSSALETLPDYQKKSTMLDALCHSVESFWSVNSNEKSREYSKQALELILENKDGYLQNDPGANEKMLEASHIAGKAINITQTTAGHAMCYKLTSLYGIAHGHAAALCDSKLIPFMINNLDLCIDSRGKEFLPGIFDEMANTMGCKNQAEMADKFEEIVSELDLPKPSAKDEDFKELVSSVNATRLKNHPVKLTEETIDMIYHQILD